MSEKNRNMRTKSQYIDVKSILQPPVVTAFILIAVLSFTAVKLITDGVRATAESEAFSGKSILNQKNYVISNSGNTEFKDMGELSLELSRLSSTHTEWTEIDKKPAENGFFCIASEQSDKRLVYNIDPENVCGKGYKLGDFDYIWVDSAGSTFYALINIPGEVVDLSDYYILVHDDSGNLASRLIINCYEAKAVKLNNAIITGTLLAPNANVEYDSTWVYGQVYAKASTGVRAYYKEIAFGGYAALLKEPFKAEFMNVSIRSAVLEWLKENYPEIYAGYPDSYVPESTDIERVTELTLDDKLIADLGDDLKYFTNLKKLSCRRTKLKALDISGLTKLEELDISETDVESLKLPANNSLRVLKADRTSIAELDTSALTGLEELSAAYVKFKSMPDFGRLTKLKNLDIAGTGFAAFREGETAALANLEYLNISENILVKSIDLAAFKKLVSANVSGCSIEKLDLTGCDALKSLDLSYNKFKNIDLRPAAGLETCNAFGDYTQINASGMNVAVHCADKTQVIK